MSEVVLTKANFEDEVLKSKVPVLVDFWAVWCGPCKMVAPVLTKLSEKHAGKLNVGKVNVDEQQALAQRYGVMSIPTLMVFKDGKAVQTVVGARPKETILQMMK